jgi:hypothetical protein
MMARRQHRIASRGLLGRRRITCLQTIDIGRLTSDPVWLTPGGFIGVSGEGPSDSNESSKTTFEAALSLIHGDPGWRQESPQFSGHAAALLFKPSNAPTGAQVRAEVGFIVAVFDAAPADHYGDDRGGPLTVWMRIRRHDDPAFEVAVVPGIRLAWGDTQRERLEEAKLAWFSLRGPKWGPQRYARELYGPGVSCLSYVSKRGGRVELRNTLLGSDVSQLTPEHIAGQLVDLAGMRQLLDNEATERVDYFRLTRDLKTKSEEVSKAATSVAHYTMEVESIDHRLTLLDDAGRARDRYVATTVRQTLGALAEHRATRDGAAVAVEEATLRVAEITERLAGLDRTVVAREVARTADELSATRAARQPAADQADRLDLDLKVIERDLADTRRQAALWSGRRVDAVSADLQRAREAAEQATGDERVAAQHEQAAADHLDAVRNGTAGPAGQRLTTAGIDWQLLHDGVELAPEARPLFEPLLEPFIGAICVAPEQEPAAITALADLPGTQLVAGAGPPLPPGILAAPPGAAGLLTWIAAEGHRVDGATTLPGRVTVIGGFDQPTTGRRAREAAASAAWEAAVDDHHTAAEGATQARRQVDELLTEHAAAEAEHRRAELDQRRDNVRREIAAITARLVPLNDAVEHADSAHRDAQAAQRGLTQRQKEVADHLKTCKAQLTQQKAHYNDILNTVDNLLLPTWVTYLDTCTPPATQPLAGTITGHRLLELPDEVTATLDARVDDVLSALPAATNHREFLTRLEADLRVSVEVTFARTEQTRATITGDDSGLDALTRMALTRYHEQAANVDRRRARDSEAREVDALDDAITALRSAVERQAQGMRSALDRARTEHARLQGEYDNAYDEVQATDTNLRNLQRGLEHQLRTLFTAISERFNEIRYRHGNHGGELDFEISPPSLDRPDENQPTGRGWILRATPRWARRPPDNGHLEHVHYLEDANTAQYKLATLQLVLAALLANDDPIGRLLILDELGDGLGDAHRERVLDALRRAADDAGITVMATVQDDMKDAAFARCTEVLFLRYRSDADLLNEPTAMFAGDPQGIHQEYLTPLRDALTSGRDPRWSALLAVYDQAAAAQAAHRRAHDDDAR